jgi:hypothetical protein
VGIDVVLMRREQHGTSPKRAKRVGVESVSGHGDAVQDVLGRVWDSGKAPLLDRIDPVSDVVLTWDDMSQLLAELDVLRQLTDGDQRLIVDRIIGLAERCESDSTLEIWFQGD